MLPFCVTLVIKNNGKEVRPMKKITKLFSVLLAVAVLLVSLPIQAEAATVKLNKTKVTIYVGKTLTLKLTGTSKKATWTSSNKKVATVSSKGKVTAKKEGTATITAKVGKKSYKCKVTVKKPYISDTKKTIYIGKPYTLKLKGTEIKSVKSSNTKVATVNKSGKVTGKKAGTATITLKGKDGKSYKCKVTIKKPYLNYTKKSIYPGDKFTLKLTGTEIKSTKSSNTKVATVDKKGKVVGKSAGKTTITVTGKDGKSYKCNVTVNPKPTPEPAEAPIVKKVGTVDDAAYEKAVKAFEGVVKKMRTDGLVKESDVCVTMDSSTINVDITFDNSDVDLVLQKDDSTKIYTLTFDYNFMWLEGFGPKVNGKDPALYNKELLIATLSMVSDEPEAVFNRIDLDCYSAASLSETEWTEIGDCFIKSNGMKVDEYISYTLTKEPKDTRNSTFTITGKTSSGTTVECVIEYDSSVVKYELVDSSNINWNVNGQEFPDGLIACMTAVDETKAEINGYPIINSGCTSYEDYKKNLIDKFIEKGDPNAKITDYNSHTVNGYTYYWCEAFFKTETQIADPDIVYVQIGENEYIEIYNIWFDCPFEKLINNAFYIKEVNIK